MHSIVFFFFQKKSNRQIQGHEQCMRDNSYARPLKSPSSRQQYFVLSCAALFSQRVVKLGKPINPSALFPRPLAYLACTGPLPRRAVEIRACLAHSVGAITIEAAVHGQPETVQSRNVDALSREACPVNGGLVQILRIDAHAGDEVVAPNHDNGGRSCRGSPWSACNQEPSQNRALAASPSWLTFADWADGKAARHDEAVWSVPIQRELEGARCCGQQDGEKRKFQTVLEICLYGMKEQTLWRITDVHYS